MNITKIEQLAISHSYYCNNTNFYSNDCFEIYETFLDFLDEWGGTDTDTIDMNLIFRWDVCLDEEKGHYSMKIFRVKQRKGIFCCQHIDKVTDEDINSILEYLQPYHNHLINLWLPFKAIQ